MSPFLDLSPAWIQEVPNLVGVILVVFALIYAIGAAFVGARKGPLIDPRDQRTYIPPSEGEPAFRSENPSV